MRLNEAFPSKYLKADVEVPSSGEIVVTICNVQVEMLGQGSKTEKKAVVYFEEIDKGLVLNKGNWAKVGQIAGSDDTDDWAGVKIAMFSVDTEYAGEPTRGIRVKVPKPQRLSKPDAEQPTLTAAKPRIAKPADPQPDDDDDDEIPF
jgi:hypothetical protein